MMNELSTIEERERLRKLAPHTLRCPDCTRPVAEITLDRATSKEYDPVCGEREVPFGPARWRCAGCRAWFNQAFVARLIETPLLRRVLARAKATDLMEHLSFPPPAFTTAKH